MVTLMENNAILCVEAMGARVFGVGIGVVLVAFIWFMALLMSLLFHRIRTILTLVFTGTAAIMTAILLAVPLDPRSPQHPTGPQAYHSEVEPVRMLLFYYTLFIVCGSLIQSTHPICC